MARFQKECAADPLLFARTVWGRRRWSAQRTIRLALAKYTLVIIFSANGVGKTNELAAYVIEDTVLNPGTRWTLTGPRFDTVRDGLFSEIRDLYNVALTNGIHLGGEMQKDQWLLGDRWDVACSTAAEPSSYQGRRGKLRTKVGIDEAQGDIAAEHWDALDSLLTGEGSQMFASGNPITSGGRFRENANDPRWHAISIDGYDHPNVKTGTIVIPGAITREWIEDRRRKWGEDDPRFIARCRGKFPPASTDQLISDRWFDGPVIAHEQTAGTHIGCDLARMGDDECVLYVVRDGAPIYEEIWDHARLTESASRIRAAMVRFGVQACNVHIDATGVGAGVADELARTGIYVDAIEFGSGAQDDWQEITSGMEIQNRRGELHWIAARLLERGHLRIPTEYSALREDLVVPKYDYHRSVFRVEEKASIKKRIGRSPDRGDAFICAVSRTGSMALGISRIGGKA